MENASKALIIAGAILLSILIIGLGMMVFDMAKEALTGQNLSAEKAAAFNSKFEAYTVGDQRGSQIRNLCDLVKNNNLVADESETYTIKISYGTNTDKTEATDINVIKNSIKNANLYTVTVTYNKDIGGLIDSVTITDKTKK